MDLTFLNELNRTYACLNERRRGPAQGLKAEVWGQMARVGSLTAGNPQARHTTLLASISSTVQ